MSGFEATTVYGVVSAAVVALAAVGFTLQFSLTNVLNIAYGAQMTLAAFLAYAVSQAAGGQLWLALVTAVLAGAVLNWAVYLGVIRPYARRRASPVSVVIVTIGLDLVLEYIVDAIWGPTSVSYGSGLSGAISIGTARVSASSLLGVGCAVLLMLALQYVLRKTKYGRAVRATSIDGELARSCGIKTSPVIQSGWLIAGALGGLAGALLGLSFGSFTFGLGDSYLVLIIASAVVGGLGSVYGAVLGAVIVSVLSQWTSLVAVIPSAYSQVTALALVVLVLILRPTGVFGGLHGAREVVE